MTTIARQVAGRSDARWYWRVSRNERERSGPRSRSAARIRAGRAIALRGMRASLARVHSQSIIGLFTLCAPRFITCRYVHRRPDVSMTVPAPCECRTHLQAGSPRELPIQRGRQNDAPEATRQIPRRQPPHVSHAWSTPPSPPPAASSLLPFWALALPHDDLAPIEIERTRRIWHFRNAFVIS